MISQKFPTPKSESTVRVGHRRNTHITPGLSYITWSKQGASSQCLCIIYTKSELRNTEIENRWFQQMLNSQIPFPFFFKEGCIIFIGRLTKRLRVQLHGRKDPPKEGMWSVWVLEHVSMPYMFCVSFIHGRRQAVMPHKVCPYDATPQCPMLMQTEL